MENKRLLLLLFFMVCMGLVLGACSNNTFTGAEGSLFQKCVDVRPEVTCRITCTSGECVEEYDYRVKTDAQIKDILFVVDNSGSMSEEQARMGQMFPNFLNILDNVNYRIAITTTDVRDSVDLANGTNMPKAANGWGEFQDGKLLPFSNNRYFLDGSLSLGQEQNLFEATITRNETLTCENNGYDANFCPSGDERGILAAHMTLENNPQDFIRPVGHMALVILSDEDEGSIGDYVNEDLERPDKFIENFKGMYPNKSITVHSVIIQPKDMFDPRDLDTNGQTSCFNNQIRPGHPPGQYGNVYAQLSSLTERSVTGDICAGYANYSQQLQAIGESVSEVREVLPCAPVGGNVQVDFIPQPSYPVNVIKNLSQNEILFSEPLPQGTEVRFRFTCREDA